MGSTCITQRIKAPRSKVYSALINARAIAKWKVPEGMICHVHEFDAREGGALRISLTYDTPTEVGKTIAHTDTYHGRFVKLVPNEQVVEIDEFETTDPTLQGEMTTTITLTDADGGTELVAVHDGLPAYHSPTMKSDGEWRLRNWQRLSRLAEKKAGGCSMRPRPTPTRTLQAC
jgi:uncharacterized protein YndB with AHSA1/START domain